MQFEGKPEISVFSGYNILYETSDLHSTSIKFMYTITNRIFRAFLLDTHRVKRALARAASHHHTQGRREPA